MPTNEELIEEYKRKREKIKQMGGPAAIEKRHQAGQWSARVMTSRFYTADYLFQAVWGTLDSPARSMPFHRGSRGDTPQGHGGAGAGGMRPKDEYLPDYFFPRTGFGSSEDG